MFFQSFYQKYSYGYFTHPASVCMSYLEHFMFSMSLSAKLALGSAQAFVHALYPDAFITSSSDLVNHLQEEMKKVGCKDED